MKILLSSYLPPPFHFFLYTAILWNDLNIELSLLFYTYRLIVYKNIGLNTYLTFKISYMNLNSNVLACVCCVCVCVCMCERARIVCVNVKCNVRRAIISIHSYNVKLKKSILKSSLNLGCEKFCFDYTCIQLTKRCCVYLYMQTKKRKKKNNIYTVYKNTYTNCTFLCIMTPILL